MKSLLNILNKKQKNSFLLLTVIMIINAVLEIIENDKLQDHANKVGNYFLDSLKKLQNNYSQRIRS